MRASTVPDCGVSIFMRTIRKDQADAWLWIRIADTLMLDSALTVQLPMFAIPNGVRSLTGCAASCYTSCSAILLIVRRCLDDSMALGVQYQRVYESNFCSLQKH